MILEISSSMVFWLGSDWRIICMCRCVHWTVSHVYVCWMWYVLCRLCWRSTRLSCQTWRRIVLSLTTWGRLPRLVRWVLDQEVSSVDKWPEDGVIGSHDWFCSLFYLHHRTTKTLA